MSELPHAAALAAVAVAALIGTIGALTSKPAVATAVEHRPPVRRLRRVLAAIGASGVGRRLRRDRLVRLRDASGAAWTADELVGSRLLGSSIIAVAAFATPVPPLAAPLALLAWRVPKLALARVARRRLADASREVPLFLDLLAVATSAGLAPQLAVRIAAEPLTGPLAEELRAAIGRVDLGRRWRDELGLLADRLTLLELRRTAAVLGRSESLGSALADEVARLASDVRASRRARAAERARTAPVKMLFPLVFLILPAFLLLTVVPVLLSTVRSIG
jgi:Flp pilus assembly protein TadB